MSAAINIPILALWPQLELVRLAVKVASSHDLEPSLVCAICEQESGLRNALAPGLPENWDPSAIRFEPGFERRYIHPANPAMPTTEELTRAMSFGVMQIMGEVAREHGFTGHFLTELCLPPIGLEFGCRDLERRLHAAQDNTRQALLLWNGGGDPQYPDKVLARIGKYAAS